MKKNELEFAMNSDLIIRLCEIWKNGKKTKNANEVEQICNELNRRSIVDFEFADYYKEKIGWN